MKSTAIANRSVVTLYLLFVVLVISIRCSKKPEPGSEEHIREATAIVAGCTIGLKQIRIHEQIDDNGN